MHNLKIAILSPTQISFAPSGEVTHPLPGAECMALELKKLITELGHECYLSFETDIYNLKEFFASHPVDVFIISRFYQCRSALPDFTLNARIVLWIHDLPVDVYALSGRRASSLAMLFDKYDTVVFVSEWQRCRYLMECGPDNKFLHKSVVAYHFFDPQPYNDRFVRTQDVIHFAHPRKALYETLCCFRELRRLNSQISCAIVDCSSLYQEEKFLFLGEHVTLPKAIKMVFGNIPSWLSILPALPPHDHRVRLSSFKIYLHPDSSIETGALSCIEALALGLIPIVSDVGCLPELVGDSGLIVPYNDLGSAEKYARSILWLLGNGKIMKQLRLQCSCRYIGQFLQPALQCWRNILVAPAPLALDLHCNVYGNYNSPFSSIACPPASNITLKSTPPKLRKLGIYCYGYINPQYSHAGLYEPIVVVRDLVGKELIVFLREMARLSSQCAVFRFLILSSAVGSGGIGAFLGAITELSESMATSTAYLVDLDLVPNFPSYDPFTQRRTLSSINKCSKYLICNQAVSSEEIETFYRMYASDGAEKDYAVIQRRAFFHRSVSDKTRLIPILMRSFNSDDICGFALVCGNGDVAHLHVWGTNKRHRNSHKYLIYSSIVIAKKNGYRVVDVGGDLRIYDKCQGLSELYSRFSNCLGSYVSVRLKNKSTPRKLTDVYRYEVL